MRHRFRSSVFGGLSFANGRGTSDLSSPPCPPRRLQRMAHLAFSGLPEIMAAHRLLGLWRRRGDWFRRALRPSAPSRNPTSNSRGG